MVKLYTDKIRTGSINSNTGATWKVEDVPIFWRAKVVKELEG